MPETAGVGRETSQRPAPVEGVATTFTFACKTCGRTVQVTDTVEQPHRCRIEVS